VKKEKALRGTIKKVDVTAGTFTVAVKSKKTEATVKEFKLAPDTPIIVLSGTERKEFTAKDGSKIDGLKAGAAVTVVTAKKDSSQVKEVRLGETKKKKKST
jgi:hypothetical protein